MRKLYAAFLLLLCFASGMAQERTLYPVYLKNGTVFPPKNLDAAQISVLNQKLHSAHLGLMVFIQFQEHLRPEQKMLMRSKGMMVLDLIPENTYVVRIMRPLDLGFLQKQRATSVFEIIPYHKKASVTEDNFPKKVWTSIFESFSIEEVTELFKSEGFEHDTTSFSRFRLIKVDVPADGLSRLIRLTPVAFVEEAYDPVPLNYLSTAYSRANVLQSTVSNYGLTGEGVTVGIDDAGNPQGHVDLADRIVDNLTVEEFNYHSTHVHGIVGGAGLRNPLYTGYAPKASLFPGRMGRLVHTDLAPLQRDYGLVLANNSWQNGTLCFDTTYNIASRSLDKQVLDFPGVLQVFAAGNSGNTTCMNYPAGYGTVIRGGNDAKNVISVGNINSTGNILNASSKGPGSKGRIKPDLVAPGTGIFSTVPYHIYFTNTGTSMSAPAVTGGLALLYQRYRQLHAGSDPKSALMKALICNSANDLGNKGPDFIYGFGSMNLLRAVEILNTGHYLEDSVKASAIKKHLIQVPAGVAQLKVMLYWHDQVISVFSSEVLGHDLDLEVKAPSGQVTLPYVLDARPAFVASVATHGIDRINNTEQVVIDHPAPGTYELSVKGFDVDMLPDQSYVLVYDFLPDSVRLTSPSGGEKLAPGEQVIIQWDSWGNSTSGFSLEYSTDSGATWQSIQNNIASGARQLTWTVPNVITATAMVRIHRTDGRTNIGLPFTIMPVPVISLSASQCPGYFHIEWPLITGAEGYEVLMKKGNAMQRVGYTLNNHFSINGLSADSVYWVSVQATANGITSRRGEAVGRQPVDGTCNGNISENDIMPFALVAPGTGRKFTTTQLGVEQIKVQVRNLDDQNVTGFSIQYNVNDGPWRSEASTVTIPANQSIVHAFTSTYDFSSSGNYRVKVVVKNNAQDENVLNDTAVFLIRHLKNEPLDISSPVMENFDSARVRIYSQSFQGLYGIERFDFESRSVNGRLNVRPLGVGPNVLAILEVVNAGDTNVNALSGTFNLSRYSMTDEVQMDVGFTRLGIGHAKDLLQIRGSDADDWITAIPINRSGVPSPGGNLTIELTRLLQQAGQQFSASFQVRFVHAAGQVTYRINHLKLFTTNNDIELASIDSLKVNSCALGSAVPVHIKLKNHSDSMVRNIIVKYQVNGGSIVSETIPGLAPDSSIAYKFIATADFSFFQSYQLKAWAEVAGDARIENNFRMLDFYNHALKQAPIIETFEESDGGWKAEGVNNSWQWGGISGSAINDAASGSKAWKTNLNGNYGPGENSILTSPCYDVRSLSIPIISMSTAVDLEDCVTATLCDNYIKQYAIDGGPWQSVYPMNGYNFYPNYVEQKHERWRVSSYQLPKNSKTIQFRYIVNTDQVFHRSGIGIDNVHVFDSTMQIYDAPVDSMTLQQQVSNSSQWQHFSKDGKIVASLQSNGQDLGITKLLAFINRGSVRNFHGQHYLDRNFILDTEKVPADSITVRLYYLDKEVDAMLFAQTCNACTAPSHAHRLGISHYTGDPQLNGIAGDNHSGLWNYIHNSKVQVIPFNNGYYIEFKIKASGEFYLNNGGLNKEESLPVTISKFSGMLSGRDKAVLNWTTRSEINIHHFEIELAKGNEAYEAGNFSKISELPSAGLSAQPQDYAFNLTGTGRQGVEYFRIKAVDEFGNFAYSKPVPIVWSNELEWIVYPNPTSGKFQLRYQVNAGEKVGVKIFNASGGLLRSFQLSGNGFVQLAPIDLGRNLASGVYLLKLEHGSKPRFLKLVKQ
jgi:hypothetical protein